MEIITLALKIIGVTSIITIVGLVICSLACLGYNLRVEYQDKNKKVEAHIQDVNSNTNEFHE